MYKEQAGKQARREQQARKQRRRKGTRAPDGASRGAEGERKGTTKPFKKRPVGTRKRGPGPRQRELQQGKVRDWGPKSNFANERKTRVNGLTVSK